MVFETRSGAGWTVGHTGPAAVATMTCDDTTAAVWEVSDITEWWPGSLSPHDLGPFDLAASSRSQAQGAGWQGIGLVMERGSWHELTPSPLCRAVCAQRLCSHDIDDSEKPLFGCYRPVPAQHAQGIRGVGRFFQDQATVLHNLQGGWQVPMLAQLESLRVPDCCQGRATCTLGRFCTGRKSRSP